MTPNVSPAWSQKTVDIGRVLAAESFSFERIEGSGQAKVFILTSLEASRLHSIECGRNQAGYEGDLRAFLVATCSFHAVRH